MAKGHSSRHRGHRVLTGRLHDDLHAITFSKELNLLGGSLYLGASSAPARRAARTCRAAHRFLRAPPCLHVLRLIAAVCTLVVNLCVDDEKGGGAAGGRRRRRAGGAAAAVGTRRLVGFAAVLGGRFSSVAAVNVAYIISAEMFPELPHSGIGWGTGCGRIGAMLGPLIMATIPLLLVTFSTLCLGAPSAWLLPESAGTAMADARMLIGEGIWRTAAATDSRGDAVIWTALRRRGIAVEFAAAAARENGGAVREAEGVHSSELRIYSQADNA